MPISSIPAPHSDETPKTSRGIINAESAQRLRLTRESDEQLIRESATTVLSAEEDLLTGYKEMTGVEFNADEHASILLIPEDGSSRELPEHDVEMAAWDALYQEMQIRFSILLALQAENKDKMAA